jgi:hypothetical protein
MLEWEYGVSALSIPMQDLVSARSVIATLKPMQSNI